MKAQENKDFLHASIKKFIITDVPVAEKTRTIKSVFQELKRKKEWNFIDHIYVVDENEKLVGVLSIKDAFHLPENTVLEAAMQSKIISASPRLDIEKIAHLALKHSISAVPIVEGGRLIGIIPSKNISSILNNALRKDLFHFAGIHKSHLEYENSLAIPLSESIAHRVPWLLIGLLGVMAIAAFVGVFEQTLEKYLILAFFMPAVAYMSNALGTQLQIIFIRDLAIMGEELKPHRYLLRQMAIAFLLSVIVSAIMWAAISAFWGQPYISFVISLATFASMSITSFTALMTTLTIQRMGFDPALGGGPFATIISDVTSVIVYFIVATILL